MSDIRRDDNSIAEAKTPLVLGILAHVDAGKTTLSEALLFEAGAIRRAGRVDHGDAFLDTYSLEKERGITIFSKQAVLETAHRHITLLDTPGHADFSPEMERSLKVLDLAVLVVSAADSVTGRVGTLWRLLDTYGVPRILFVNKMDQPGSDREALMADLKTKLGERILDFEADRESDAFQEAAAVLDERLLSAYLEGKRITDDDLRALIAGCKAAPVFFGSALHRQGTDRLLTEIDRYAPRPVYGERFGARVFKISREEGVRLTWIKLTGGRIAPRQMLEIPGGEEPVGEKIDQIRLYSGSRFTLLQEAEPGYIYALTGLGSTRAGMGLGAEADLPEALLQPIFASTLELPPGTDRLKAYRDLKLLEEEEPLLHVSYAEETGEITCYVMGQVQREILRHLAYQRFGLLIEFGPERIVYKETIAAPVEGVGHYEPLRHYAEVHLLLEPAPPGSGIVIDNRCSTDVLARNWQRLILSHIEEKRHKGVLTGSEITDMKITLLTGAASIKHTEGGDFRQATYRAIRQGLMMAENILLEPVLSLRLDLPSGSVGRALSDVTRMGGSIAPVNAQPERTVLEGQVRASAFGDYAAQVMAYTGGDGEVVTSFAGYAPCPDAEEVIRERGYVPELDNAEPCGSVFCAHGAGFVVPWDQVRDYMHLDSGWQPQESSAEASDGESGAPGEAAADVYGGGGLRAGGSRRSGEPESYAAALALDAELKAIFERTYGPIRQRTSQDASRDDAYEDGELREKGPGDPKYEKRKSARQEAMEDYLLVDGYNIIYAWEDLRALAEQDIKAARDALKDILVNYAGFVNTNVILVFDAYRVAGEREIYRYNNIDVIYTRQAETADLYIEKTAHALSRRHRVTVATSDAVEQVIIFSAGALRMSALGLKEAVEAAARRMREEYGLTS